QRVRRTGGGSILGSDGSSCESPLGRLRLLILRTESGAQSRRGGGSRECGALISAPSSRASDLPSASQEPSGCRTQEAPERGTFHVTGRGAYSRVPQAVSHGSQLANRPVQFFGLCAEHLSVDPRPAIRREHARDLI